MFQIGCHISSEGGYYKMAQRAVQLGANTFAFFTRNPRGGAVKPIQEADAAKFLDYCQAAGIQTIVAHAPYTVNPCAEKESVLEFAYRVFQEDLERMEHTPGQYYNFHPGSHVGQGTQAGIEKLTRLLNTVLWPQMQTTVLLETMAGKGSEIGKSFEELQQIIAGTKLKDKIGVCLDTCHVWDAGYDLERELDKTLEAFERIIGLSCLKAIHLNNSLNPCGARKDRHARIREGTMSMAAIENVICHSALRDLPFILETPNDAQGYAQEIALLQSIREKKSCS